MNFLFDANISWRLCDMLGALEQGEHRVLHIRKHSILMHNNNEFGNSTPDTEWLSVLGQERPIWTVISGDTS